MSDTDAARTVTIDGVQLVVRQSEHISWYGKTWDVFQIIEGAEKLLTLTDGWGKEPTEQELAAFMHPRKQRLQKLMAQYGIRANGDYQYEDTLESLQGAAPLPRFISIYGDETYHMFDPCETIQDALESQGDLHTEEYLNVAVGVYDLDEERLLHVETIARLRRPEDREHYGTGA